MNAAAPRYFPPNPQFTGRCQWQPLPAAIRSGWHFDAALNYHDTGFIDAPAFIPTGSVRGLDVCLDICLGIDHQPRESRS